MTSLKFGRLAPHPVETHPRLAISPYLTPVLPPIPATVDYVSRVTAWPMYLNDQLGDCTIAAAGHMTEAYSTYGEGTTIEITDNDVLKAYEAVAGYVPGDPSTDGGAVMQDVLQHWVKVGIGGHKLDVFAQVDHGSASEVKAALYLFGHVYVGVNLPASAMKQFEAGEPWDVVADDGGIEGGHAIDLGYADATGYKVVTWGRVQSVTHAWWAKYVEEAWTAISPEWFTKGASPEGVDLPALGEAFAQLTGKPNPFPAPTPGPTPGPTPPADADAALVTALNPWVAEHHTGVNAKAAKAFVAWREAKHL